MQCTLSSDCFNLNNIELVIFDKDGTLIDIHHYWVSMIKLRAQVILEMFLLEYDKENVIKALTESMGADITNNKIKEEGPVGLKPRAFIIDVVTNASQQFTKVSRENIESAFIEADKRSLSILNELTKPLDGVEKLLSSLKNHSIKTAIATSDLSNRAKLAMKELDMFEMFDDYIGSDSVKNPKPHPEMVELICTNFNIAPKNTVVIGDSLSDLNLSRNSATHFIGVNTGLISKEFKDQSNNFVNTLNEINVGEHQ